MSIEARKQVVNSPMTVCSDSHRADLLDPSKTNTNLIAFILEMIHKGNIIQFTAVRSDHHNDSGLNPTPPHEGTHGAGYAFDCWPLRTQRAADWVDVMDDQPIFAKFLRDAADSPYLYQIGLAGSALNQNELTVDGHRVFEDSGADHVHIGVHA